MLWITFKSCIFAFWNNKALSLTLSRLVVNYIQILYLCILKQLLWPHEPNSWCCELHSNLVSLHSETTRRLSTHALIMLWITFKSCIFAFWNNWIGKQSTLPGLWITFKSCIFAFWNNIFCTRKRTTCVVNYIQILYLCILKQRIWEPPHASHVVNYIQILYLCILKQHACCLPTTFVVVNYIQILYLCILKQHPKYQESRNNSCELHSNLVSLHSETTWLKTKHEKWSCELHSNLVSLHSETTEGNYIIIWTWLWITFKSCIFAFWNNGNLLLIS